MIGTVNAIGNFCIGLCLLASFAGAGLAFAGMQKQKESWIAISKKCVYLTFFAMTVANLVMVYALLANDFSVSYVAHVGARETPRFFAAISLWSSLEGSILLWGWVLSSYTAFCIYRYRNQFENLMPWVTITLLGIGIFFYIVLLIPANPFIPTFPIPENGPGPNPLLQNHWLMALHPPFLYLGYVGMSVPFSFAVASMLSGDLSNTWVQATRRWTLIAWMCLSIAIILGGWWSYAVLGWGGYWAWDPVENASFMPWLTATAFLHSIMVQQKRQMLKIWNLVLISITFFLTILGTFLTRSGVMESVHSFTQSDIGHYFLYFLSIILAISAALLIWKSSKFKSEGKLDHPLSRETIFLFNNLLLLSFCLVVLLGTLYPLLIEALQGAKISVGEPFFNQMTLPLAILLLFLMGIGSAVPWAKAEPSLLFKLLVGPSIAALLVPLLAYFFGIESGWVLATLAVSAFSIAVIKIEGIQLLWRYWRVQKLSFWQSILKIFRTNPRRYGGFTVHIGVIIIAIGIAFSGSYQQEFRASLKEGEVFDLGNQYSVQMNRLRAKHASSRFEIIAETSVIKNGKTIGMLSPQMNYYAMSREPVGSPAVRSTIWDDLYLTLMSFDAENRHVTLRILYTPLVSWIWFGGLFIIVGVLISVGLKINPKNESRSSKQIQNPNNMNLKIDI